MTDKNKHYKIAYCTPALYMAGGVERVLTLKANYLADVLGYDITIILTEGKDKPSFYPLSDKITVVNLDINFEVLWNCSIAKKIFIFFLKQCIYKKRLTKELIRIKPDITVSTLRREINFLTNIPDGSKKVGELHVNRYNYRDFDSSGNNFIKKFISKIWMNHLIQKIYELDSFVVLSKEDKNNWYGISNVRVIPDPLSLQKRAKSNLLSKRIIAVGRYTYQKGFDLLLQAWSRIEKNNPDWSLAIYGEGDRSGYYSLLSELGITPERCQLNECTKDIQKEYLNSSIFVFSSRYEGFGLVLVEAMSCGLPVVSFACPCGPRDIIDDGENGFLIEPGDVDSFSKSIQKLMNNPALRKKMSEKAFNSVEKYSLDSIMKKWCLLFESILNK